MKRNAFELDKRELSEIGHDLSVAFLDANGIPKPQFGIDHGNRSNGFKSGYGCGWYRRDARIAGGKPFVSVTTQACARPAVGVARSWSFPSYKTDRTPVGVVAHEVGHHVDAMLHDVSYRPEWRALAKERITSYEPNMAEAFAESLRVFILNPGLLRMIAPGRYEFLRNVVGLKRSEQRKAEAVLKSWSAPESYLNQVAKRRAVWESRK